MASTTQEKIIPLDSMKFAEFADPSYFIFANRAARMQQEQKIVPGMAWNLFNDAIPEEKSPKACRRESIEEINSSKPHPTILDEQGEQMNFQDPWEGLRETHDLLKAKNAKNSSFKSIGSDLDVSCFFFGY